jgi:hypothetical protein
MLTWGYRSSWSEDRSKKNQVKLKYQRNSSEIIGVIRRQFCGHQIIIPDI